MKMDLGPKFLMQKSLYFSRPLLQRLITTMTAQHIPKDSEIKGTLIKEPKVFGDQDQSCNTPTSQPFKKQKKNYPSKNIRKWEKDSSEETSGKVKRDTRPGTRPEGYVPEKKDGEKRLPKRKCAILMGFCGKGYSGMQINHNAKTIEGDLFNALVSVGAISKENSDCLQKVKFTRSSRTDKGVHAAGQVVSLNLIVDIENLLQKVNDFLPPQIRVWDIVRTLNSFHSKHACDSRVYEYILPTYAFRPRDLNKPIPEVTEAISDDAITSNKSFRIPTSVLSDIRSALKLYEGTFRFHNFTTEKSFGDSSSKRHIKSFTVSEPFMVHDMEWLSLKVHGQSFMFNQIRKMIGLVVMIIRTQTPISIIPRTYENVKLNIPKAPGLGLLLEQGCFEGYNQRLNKEKLKKPEEHTLTSKKGIDFKNYEKEILIWKQKFIYDVISEEEVNSNSFAKWLQLVDNHLSEFTYLNPEGEVKEATTISVPSLSDTESMKGDEGEM